MHSHPPLLFFGRISYPLYLLHQFFGVSLIRELKLLGAPDVIAAASAALCVTLAAFAVTTVVEVPAKRALMRFGHRALFSRWSQGALLGYRPRGAEVRA